MSPENKDDFFSEVMFFKTKKKFFALAFSGADF